MTRLGRYRATNGRKRRYTRRSYGGYKRRSYTRRAYSGYKRRSYGRSGGFVNFVKGRAYDFHESTPTFGTASRAPHGGKWTFPDKHVPWYRRAYDAANEAQKKVRSIDDNQKKAIKDAVAGTPVEGYLQSLTNGAYNMGMNAVTGALAGMGMLAVAANHARGNPLQIRL